ncbi:MAG: hypothetical protein FJX80_06520 [Bacteroidetes bacterium]|nr:hypothetical protein [Bacteroidota bacterium]
MNREIVIAKYINAVEKILVAFHLNIEPENEDTAIVTLKTKEFTNALRELYLSNDENKNYKYKVIFDVINKASFRIVKENFETNPLGTWAVIIYNLELAFKHISELHFKETDYYYPFPKLDYTPHQTETETEKLKIEQIALKYAYEGIQITRENGNEIAKKFGHNSGEKLFQRFTYFLSAANRKAKPTTCTPRKLKNKIELFESVVNHLSDNSKQRAIDEINILKTIFENEYQ